MQVEFLKGATKANGECVVITGTCVCCTANFVCLIGFTIKTDF